MVALGEAQACSDLEAMRREDSSWHPCQVSLSSTRVGLTICFENDELEDMEVNTEEALACLRFRSAPLEGDDCSSMKQGDCVLAADKSKSKSLFYDAEVEEVVRVKHSKRVFCRCTFLIRWLHRDLNAENLTVPSSSIMRLAAKSVSLHPTVDKFLKMITDIDSPASSSPFSPVLEDLNGEIDINKLIDQQIEQITNAVDASEGIARDILLGVKANTGDIEGEIRSKRNNSHAKARDDQNHFKRSTRSSKKLAKDEQVEAAPEPAPAPMTEEKHESMSQLSPLAARALLASFTAMNGTRLSDFLTDDNLYVKNKLSSKEPVSMPKPSSCSIVEKNSGQTVQMRVTRSTVKTGSTNERRLTRSAIREEKEVGVGPEQNPSNSKGSVSRRKTDIQSEQRNGRQVSGTVETSRQTEAVTLTATAKLSGRLTRSAVREGKEVSSVEVGKGREEASDAVETHETKGDNEGRKRKSSSVSSHKQERRFSPRNHSQEKAATTK